MGLSKSGFAAGIGALAVPLMALAVPVPQAAAIMLPLLLAADLTGLAQLLPHCDWRLIRLLLPAGLVGIALGWVLFGWLSVPAVAGLVGLLTLVFVAIRVFLPARADAPPPSRRLGRLMAALSGFTSFVAHAGSPPIGFYVLPLKLPPLVFSATYAVFFAALNLSKWLPYAVLGLVDATNMTTSLVLLPLPMLGVWLGVQGVRRLSPGLFNRIFLAGMLLTGLKLLWDGARGLQIGA
ncbi:MAG: sulfite exporter TauE/SafE family protein [Burkholderiales bacterium]|nr:sulfite exporter TauE/SafE family protein [Burkholderiales bacterium]